MKLKIKSTEKAEILRILKADDMANFIWELVHNGWREFKHTDYEYEKAWQTIDKLLMDHNINIDELMDD